MSQYLLAHGPPLVVGGRACTEESRKFDRVVCLSVGEIWTVSLENQTYPIRDLI